MITIGQLVEYLSTLPQDIPVTGYGGDESTGFITKESVRLEHTDQPFQDKLYYRDEAGAFCIYSGPFLDIMAGE